MTYSIVCGYPAIPLIRLENTYNQTTTKDVSTDKFNVEVWSSTGNSTGKSKDNIIGIKLKNSAYTAAGELGCQMKYDMFPLDSIQFHLTVYG